MSVSSWRSSFIAVFAASSVCMGTGVVTAQTWSEYGQCDRVSGIFGSQAIEGEGLGTGFRFDDFDGDGVAELIRLDAESRRVRILRQDHHGDWVERSSVQFSEDANRASIGDFNGDGHADVFICNRFEEWCGFALGSPGLQLSVGGEMELTRRLFDAVSFDLNGDGFDDVIATTSDHSRIAFFRGDGTAGLLAPEYWLITEFSVGGSILSADVNVDGTLDLVVAGDDSAFAVMLGDGDGFFESPLIQPIGGEPMTLDLADLNGDGHLDVVAACFEAQLLETWAGFGDGQFGVLQSLPMSHRVAAATAGDVNGDGSTDVALVHQTESTIRVLLNDGSGELMLQAAHYGGGWLPRVVHIREVTGDGVPDLVIDAQESAMPVLSGVGNGTFLGDRMLPLVRSIGNVMFSDLNDDDLDDVIGTAGGGELDVYLGTGGFAISFHDSVPTGGSIGDLALVDVVGTDANDVVTISNLNDIAYIRVLEGAGDGQFVHVLERTLPFEGRDIELGEVTGDEFPDAIIWSASEPMIHVLPGSAAGFEEKAHSFAAEDNVRSGGSADVNGDGNVDVTFLVRDQAILGAIAGDGSGGFGERIDIPLTWVPSAYAFGDATNDGIDDLVYVTRDLPSNRIVVMSGTGSSFEESQVIETGSAELGPVHIGDLDQDGYSDVLVRHWHAAVYLPCYGEPSGQLSLDRQFRVGNEVVSGRPILMTDLANPDHVGIVGLEDDLPGLHVRTGHCHGRQRCIGDLDSTLAVDVNDLLLLIGAWGTDGGDLNGSGSTDIDDLLMLISAWGPCD